MKNKLLLLLLPVLIAFFLSVGLVSAQEPTPAPEIDDTLITLFFGDVWYFGFLIFLIIALVALKLWKYAGAILIPIFIIFEQQYYIRLAINPELVWAMIFCGAMIVGIAAFTISLGSKRNKND